MEINTSEPDGRGALNARLRLDLMALGDRKQRDVDQRDREWLANLAAQPDPALVPQSRRRGLFGRRSD